MNTYERIFSHEASFWRRGKSSSRMGQLTPKKSSMFFSSLVVMLAIWFFSTAEEEKKPLEPCKNKEDNANCEHWAGLGFCQSRAEIMIDKCQHACNSCPKG